MSSLFNVMDKVGRKPKEHLMTPEGPMTFSQAAKKYKLTKGAISGRRSRGWSDEKIISTPLMEPGSQNKLYVTYRGKRRKLCDIVKGDSNRHRVYKRLKDGWDADEAIDLPAHTKSRGDLYTTPYGKINVGRLAKFLGMSRLTLRNRLNRGWPEDEAFNTPAFGVRGTHLILPWEEYYERKAQYEDDNETTEPDISE